MQVAGACGVDDGVLLWLLCIRGGSVWLWMVRANEESSTDRLSNTEQIQHRASECARTCLPSHATRCKTPKSLVTCHGLPQRMHIVSALACK